MVPLLLSAVLALTAVAVADRAEQRLVAPAAPAATVLDATPADAPSAPGNASPTTQSPPTSAALPAGEMVLTLADGSAAISTGADDPIFELGTTTIGDLDLSGAEPVIAQGDGEVSADWGDVTEWYRAVGDGIEHGYTVDEPVSTGDELTVTVDVTAGEPTLVDGQNVAIERADGGIVWYRGLFAFDANGTDLPAEMAVVDGDIELRIDTAGAEYPITIDPTISELQKLVTDPDAAGDRFGESVAIDGVPGDMTIVVGAVGDDGEQGVAYVFRNEGFGWVQAAKLYPPTPGDRQFGWDVDVRGDVVVVGAPGDDANGPDAGAVYVFEPTGPFEPWQQTAVVYQCDPSVVSPCGETAAGAGFDGAGFGFAVDLTDQFLLVGAPGYQSSLGGAWVYQRSGSDWQTSTAGVLGRTGFAPGIDGPPAAGDEFGYAVAGADTGTHIVVGAPGDDNFVGIDAGRTFYFQWDGSALSAPVLLTSGNTADGNTGAHVDVEIDAQGDAWMFSGAPVNTRFEDGTEPGVSYSWRYVLPAGAAPIDANLLNYGSSAATPAQAAFTGAHVVYADSFADSSATDAGSAVYFPVLPDADPAFNRLGTGLYPSLPANAGDRWGFDVAATGDTYVIGGPGNDAAGTDAGEVRIGSFSSFGALEVLSPDLSFDPARLGTAVAVDGDRMVASAPFESAGASGAGVVYVYERADAIAPWTLATSFASPDPEFDGGFGDALDLRGPLLAIGESDRFGDSAEPGRVWVYAFTGSAWELQGPALAPAIVGAENGDQFGASLAWIDETVLAIGAPGTSGSIGRVALVNDTGAGWNVTEVTTPVEVTPVTGDQFGFAVAAGSGDLSGTNLFVGAPGGDDGGPEGGVLYRFSVVEGVATWTNSFGYVAGGRVGTSVDTSGDTAVAAGYGGGTLSVQILEYIPNPDPLDTDRPFVWNGDGGVSVGVGFIPEDGPINDYVALDGTTIAVGRPGGGGSVAVFQRGASGWPTVPDIEIVPAGRQPGDRIGHAIALDGTTLAVGAPGDDGLFGEFPDSGAVYNFRLPATATFVNPTPFASWNDPTNWDVGVVPSPGDAVVVPAGTYPELPVGPAATIDTLSVAGQLRLRGDLTVETSSTIATFATVDLQPTATFDPSGDVTLDGLLNNAGPVVIDGPGSITGSGRFVNDDVLRKTGIGTLTIGPDVVWTSRFYSELDVAGGSVEILGDLIDDNGPATATVTAGTFRVAAGSSLVVGEDGVVGADLIVGPGTTFVTEITGPPSSTANYGRIVVGSALGFDRTVPNPGPGLVGFEAIVNGYDVDVADVYPVITCANDCAPDLGGGVLSVEFDDLALSGLTPVQTRTAIELRTVANKVIAPDPGVGFGTDLAVDGDLAVVGTLSGGPLWVYRYVSGAWEVAQSLSNGTAERVAVDGTTIFADGLRYNPVTPGGLFDADEVIDGTTFDVDDRLVVRGEAGGPAGTAVVRLAAGGPDEPLVPSSASASFGADVAIVDLGAGAAIAAVSAPSAGRVYLFDLAVNEGAGTVSATQRGFVSGGSDFGRSIALSADRLVVGDPFDGTPIAGAGAARVYERTGPGAVFAASPVKLQASDAEVSDTFGDDVAIDGDVIVVGAPIAQKFAFPLRDGAAYVYQFNGVSWVETDKLRADDGFSEEGFGDAVAVSGNRVLVGATSDANDNGADAGAFYFYETAPPPSPFTVTTTADAGPGSLRAAIAAANTVSIAADPDPIAISFDIPGPGPHTISPATALPNITRPVVIDGFTQPGSAANTAAIDQAIDAVIQIELSGALTTGTGLNLATGSTGSTVRGLAINRFSARAIGVFGGGGHTISGNYLGVRPDGSVLTPAQGEGMQVGSSGNTIGGTGPADRNLISGNASYGIFLGPSATANVIRGNFIGTGPTGTVARPNGSAGVQISGDGNVVGGVTVGDRNLIAGNTQVGVRVSGADGNSIQGNYIGTDAGGTIALANGSGTAGQAGVLVQSGAVGTLIGGTAVGAGNLIASNDLFGVNVNGAGSIGTSILGNRITGNANLGINVLDQVLPVPAITSLVVDGVDLTVSGTVTGPVDDYRVELFANDVCDASGFGEGQYFLGSVDVTPAEFVGGTASFTAVINAPVAQSNITATATNGAGSTSTFAGCFDTATSVATFTNGAGGNLWTTPGNWSTGVVPGSGDIAVIPFGTSATIAVGSNLDIAQLTLGGTLNLDGRLELTGDSAVSGSGTLFVNSGGLLTIGAELTVDGQVATREGPPPGSIEFETGASIDGSGLIGNSGVVSFTGTGVTTIGAGLTWNSGTNSLLQVTAGTVEAQTSSIDLSGITFVAPGAALRAQGGLALADTSVLEFGIDGPGDVDTNFGRLEVPTGTFTANGQVVTTPVGGYLPTGDSYPLITCAAAGCLGGTFDAVFGGRIDTATETEISFVLVNTYVGPAPSVAPGNWDIPFAWSFGVVPDATDAAAIPPGRFVVVGGSAGPDQFAVGSLTVAGRLDVRDDTDGAGGLRFEINGDSVITPTGQLVVGGSFDCRDDGIVTPLPPPFIEDECVPSTTSMSLGADLRVDGSFRVVEAILAYPGGVYITSSPDLELGGGASLSGTGSVMLDANVAKSEPGTVTFGPDLDVNLFYRSLEPLRGVLEVTDGTLDIQSAPPNGSFVANGTIEVGPGATVSIADDLALSASSVLEFGVDGPSGNTDNYGRIVLPTGTLIADGDLLVTADGYVPTFDDIYPLISCTSGSCSSGGFTTVDTAPLTIDVSTGGVTARGPALPVELTQFDLVRTSDAVIEVAPGGIAVSSLDRTEVARRGGGAADVAASSISSIGPEDTSLAAITIGETPLKAIFAESTPLKAIPLVNIDIEGGWQKVIAGSVLENEPLATLTFGQVLETGDESVAGTPANRIANTPLKAIEVDGTPLKAIPLAAVALGSTPLKAIPLKAIGTGGANPWCDVIGDLALEYADCDAALEDLSLTEITLRGVPLKAIPLKAIPLKAIELADSPLKAILLKDAALGASPVGAIPLKAIPLKAIELNASPLKAIPLKAIPLKAIPVSAVDLEQADLGETPLKAIPLKAIPLKAIGPAGIPLKAIPTSIPLKAIPLKAIGPDGAPVSAIQVQGAPLKAIPLSVAMLADTPLKAITLEEGGVALEWCDVLAEADPSFDCSAAALESTTLSDLSVRGIPLKAIPLKAIPLKAILQAQEDAAQVAGTPLKAIPLKAIPLKAIPLKAIPLGGLSLESTTVGDISVAGTPLKAIPLKAIDVAGSPLAEIPLKAIELDASPLKAIPLKAIPLKAIPLKAILLEDISVAGSPLKAIPLKAIDVAGSPLKAIPLKAIVAGGVAVNCDRVDCESGTLGDAYANGALSGDTTLEALQSATDGIGLGELSDFFTNITTADVRAALELADLTLGDLDLLDDLTLGDLPSTSAQFGEVTLGALLEGLTEGTFSDLLSAVVDPTTGRPVLGLEAQLLAAIETLNLQLGDLERIGEVTLEDLLDGIDDNVYELTLSDIEPLLRFVTVQSLQDALGITVEVNPNTTLGDLSPEALGQLTLADLANLIGEYDESIDLGDVLADLGFADLLDDFSLGDLLLALLDPGSLAYGGVEFAGVDVDALPAGTVEAATFRSSFAVSASTPRSVSLEATVPGSAAYVSGSGRLIEDRGVGGTTAIELDPDVDGTVLSWTITASPGVTYSVEFDLLPTLRLGELAVDATVSITGTEVSQVASTGLVVADGLENNDFDQGTNVTLAAENRVYLTYVEDATDNDVFEVTVAEDERIVVELSNLDADLDLAVWGRPDDPSANAPLGRVSADAPLFAVTDPDSDATDAEPLDDFTRLDELDPTVGLVQVSNLPGTQTESLQTERLDAGTYYIQVYGSNGASNIQPAALQIKLLASDSRPAVCQAIEFLPGTGNATFGTRPLAGELAAADTLILVNEQRIERLHGPAARADLVNAAQRLVDRAADDPTLGISPVIVPVDGYQAVVDAYEDWDTVGSCDPNAANAVVAAINSAIIDGERDHIENIVILGGDEVIPMARLADETLIANEYDYRHEFDGGLAGGDVLSSFTVPFWDSLIRSDEPYGDAAARSLGDRYLYVTDVALGRLVETPGEIVDAIDTYLEFNGLLDISTATVLGYDFLSDGSAEVAAQLSDAGLPVDDELAEGIRPSDGAPWDRQDATAKLVEAGTNALVSLNAHFDHYRALPADGDGVVAFNDNLIAEDVATTLGPDALRQSLIFSMGCHSGLAVSDITISTTKVDWAQTLGQQGSLYIGNTGYGYGDTKTVAYTEQLMALFAAQVTSPFDLANGEVSTVGQALAWAKNEYVAGLQTFSVYDEKALMESTFYGLPFYRVGGTEIDSVPLPPASTIQTTQDSTGSASAQVSLSVPNTPVTDLENGGGTYFANVDDGGREQVIVAPGQPIQPKTVRDISVVDTADESRLAEVAHGAIVLDMQSTYEPLADPVIATPIFDNSVGQPEPELSSGTFPTKPLDITTTTGPAGKRQQLIVATGQYNADLGVQRLDNDIDLVVYYSGTSNSDFVAPRIGVVDPKIVNGVLNVSVTTPSSDVDRVYLLVAQNPGAPAVDWTGIDLTRTPGTNRWSGTLQLDAGTTDVEFIVQAKDTSGNVGYATNKARNFGEVTAAAVPPPVQAPPPAALLEVIPATTNLNPTTNWYEGPATVQVTTAASAATYFVNGQPQGEIAAGESFTISTNGESTWRVVAGGRETRGTVQVDNDGQPRVTLGTPRADGLGQYQKGVGFVDVRCEDASLANCALAIDGQPVTNGDPLPTELGPHQLTVSATDRVGNVVTDSADFTVVPVVASPIVTTLTVPAEPVSTGVAVELAGLFTDRSGADNTYTATVDWGDDSTADSGLVVTGPLEGTTQGGFTGSHVYERFGSFDVTVTVVDSTGRSSIKTAVVTVFDPLAPPVIRNLVGPIGPVLITDGIEISGEFRDGSVPNDAFFEVEIAWGDGSTESVDFTTPEIGRNGSFNGSYTYALPGTYDIEIAVRDGLNETTERLTVQVVAPAGTPLVKSVVGPLTPQNIANGVNISAVFSDASAPYDEFTATIDWGDGFIETGVPVIAPETPDGEGSVNGFRRYDAAGVYAVTVTVADQAGDTSSQKFEFVVVFDPDTKGRVSGSGFYWSGSEARPGGSRWGAPAFFGYDARYKGNADVPTGETQLRLLGEFFFRSTSYDYLIVNDAIAIAEGVGKIGNKQYRFRVQGIDNGWIDFFQITIWDPANGNAVVYDNGVLYDKGDLVLFGGIKVKSR